MMKLDAIVFCQSHQVQTPVEANALAAFIQNRLFSVCLSRVSLTIE